MRTLFITILFLGVQLAFSQQQDSLSKPKFTDRLHFGGGFNIGISQYNTTIGISPSALYEVSEKLGAGVSLSYIYSKWRRDDFSYNVFGGGVFVQYRPIIQFQLTSEFELMHIIKNSGSGYKDAYNVPALYLGAGYAIGKFGVIGVRYDVLWEEGKSIYREPLSPYIRVYF